MMSRLPKNTKHRTKLALERSEGNKEQKGSNQESGDNRRGLALSERMYRVLLLIYPTEFRRAYGAQMVQVFHDSCLDAQRRRRMPGLLALWLATLGDLAASAWAEWRTVLLSSLHLIPSGGVAMLHITNGDSAA